VLRLPQLAGWHGHPLVRPPAPPPLERGRGAEIGGPCPAKKQASFSPPGAVWAPKGACVFAIRRSRAVCAPAGHVDTALRGEERGRLIAFGLTRPARSRPDEGKKIPRIWEHSRKWALCHRGQSGDRPGRSRPSELAPLAVFDTRWPQCMRGFSRGSAPLGGRYPQGQSASCPGGLDDPTEFPADILVGPIGNRGFCSATICRQIDKTDYLPLERTATTLTTGAGCFENELLGVFPAPDVGPPIAAPPGPTSVSLVCTHVLFVYPPRFPPSSPALPQEA